MEKHILAEQKLAIFKSIMQIENVATLNQVQVFIDKFLSEYNSLKQSLEVSDTKEDDFDASTMTFKEWNEQFEGNLDLNEYIHEYGMTLKEFRLIIYNSERSPSHPIKEFYSKLDAYV